MSKKRKKVKIYGRERLIFIADEKDLFDMNSYRLRWNRSFSSYNSLLRRDLKKQKPISYSYSAIGIALCKRVISIFMQMLLEDICKNGETFKMPTRYGDVLLGIDKKESKVYNVHTGFESYYMGIYFDEFFWSPYPYTAEYNIFLRSKYQDIINKSRIVSKDYYEHKQIFHS